MRRRTFAASVVVTLSLAEAGCDGASTPPTDGTEEQISANPPAPTPKLDLGAEPAPDPEPELEPEPEPPDDAAYPEATVADRVHQRADGSCWEDMGGDFECPEGAMCNPPPPRRVQCPRE